MFNIRVFCISSSQSQLWKMKLPAQILEKWTEGASLPATLKKRLRTLPYGACLSPQLFICEEAAMWSFWDYQSSHRRLLQWPSYFHSNGAAPGTPALGSHSWTRCSNRSSLQETPFQASHHHFQLFYKTFRQGDRVMSQVCNYLKEAWEKGVGPANEHTSSWVTVQISRKNREARANSLVGGWEIFMKNTKSSARICVPRKEPCGPHSQSPEGISLVSPEGISL